MCDPSKQSKEYIQGINEFIEFAFEVRRPKQK